MQGLWTAAGVLAIFLARLLQSIFFTVKEILMVRGRRVGASLLSLAETGIWFVAFCVVMRDLLSGPLDWSGAMKGVAFVGGWAAGTFLGIEIEERMAWGYVTVQVISLEKEGELRERLLSEGFPLTSLRGEGRMGPRTIYQTVLPRRELPRLLRSVDGVDPKAFINLLETRGVRRGKSETGG